MALVGKAGADSDFSQPRLPFPNKLDRTLQSEMHDVTMRCHTDGSGKHSREMECPRCGKHDAGRGRRKEPAWCDPTRHGLAFEFDHEFAAQSVKSLFLARMSMRRCTRARRFIAEEQGNEPTAARNRLIRAQDPDITSA